MRVSRSVAEVLADHVTLEVEGIDRMYLNVYVPGLQREQGVACFFFFSARLCWRSLHFFVWRRSAWSISRPFSAGCMPVHCTPIVHGKHSARYYLYFQENTSYMQITWLGHGTFQFRLPSGQVIVIDPWLSNPSFPKGYD